MYFVLLADTTDIFISYRFSLLQDFAFSLLWLDDMQKTAWIQGKFF
jgi:hypothetical protein